ncbi:MAG: hypothetical protein IPM57_11055 [Oligoflexia bacterium]|nr:hypothetical protein [Oligoflexia bacterium]
MTKFFGIFGIITVLTLTACSPVKFGEANKNNGTCNVSASCPVDPTGGTFFTQQDQVFTTTNKVDILIVNDNSDSMATEQANLASPFNGFINNLMNASNTIGLDWQLAVTNTDICPQAGGICSAPSPATGLPVSGARGRFYAPVTSQIEPVYGNYILNRFTPNVANVFASTVRRVTTTGKVEVGSGDERGIYAASLAIDLRNTDNAGFFRDNSNLAIVVLSDENVRSVGGQNANDPDNRPLENDDLPQTLLNKFVTTFGGTKALVFNSIVIKSNDTACRAQQAAQPSSINGGSSPAHFGTVYEQMSNLSQNGSIIGSICDNGAGQFAQMLSQVTGSIQNLPALNRMTLNYIPSQNPVVTFTPPGNAVSWNWVPGTNVITFSQRPANGTNVHVEYYYTSGSQKALVGGGGIQPKVQIQNPFQIPGPFQQRPFGFPRF